MMNPASEYEIWLRVRCLSELYDARKRNSNDDMVNWEDAVLEGGRSALHQWVLVHDDSASDSVRYARLRLQNILSNRACLADLIERRKRGYAKRGEALE